MCKAFSCIVTLGNKCYWKSGIDSHTGLVDLFSEKDKQLRDDKEPPLQTFARCEITPHNQDYLNPDIWEFHIDEEIAPDWWKDRHENKAMSEFKKWEKKVYSRLNIKEARDPIHPFSIIPPKKITEKHLKLLKEWASVRASVGNSVWASVRASVGNSVWASVRASVGDSVRDSVRDSVWDSVRASVGDSVWASVWDSVWAYFGSIFKIKNYEFSSCAKLWKMGLVPSFNGKIWRLHGGKKAEILWEGTRDELENYNLSVTFNSFSTKLT